jgi:hypothetical protein
MAGNSDVVPFGAVGMEGADAATYEPQRGYIDTPETDSEASEGGPTQQALFWKKQIEAALVAERRWRTEAEHAERLYFGPDEDPSTRDPSAGKSANPISETTSTIHGNIEVLKPLLFSETPTPVVQRRFRGDGKATDATDLLATEVGQRMAQWVLTTTRFDDTMEATRDDWLISGRGVARAFYKAKIDEVPVTDPATGFPVIDPETGQPMTQPAKASECVYAGHWEWPRFVCAPGYSWERMPWIAFEVPTTRSEAERSFPEKAGQINYNRKGLVDRSRAPSDSDRAFSGTDDANTSGQQAASPFDTATVWEIWIKAERKVVWWSPDCGEGILDEVPDPLNLEDFWPMPKPLLATAKGSSMNPRPDIRYYEAAADEVEHATTKLKEILKTVAVAGIFPGNMEQEVQKLLSGKNAVYASQSWAALLDKGGAREMIQWLPLDAMISAINALQMLREQAKQRMFEASGVSDIMRAQGDPRESATAQNLKGKYAGMRLASRQRRMAIYARDMLRILVEIAVEMFDTAFIADICSLDLPMTKAEREAIAAEQQAMVEAHAMATQAHEQAMMQRQQVEQMAAEAGGQVTLPPPPAPPPPLPPMDKPPATSWEEVHERLRNDLSRKITITIETQSTILADEQGDKDSRIEFLAAFSTFVQQIMPLVGTGQFDMKTAKELLLFGVRAFPKSRTLEAMIAELPDELPKGEDKPDIQVQVAQIRAEVDLEIQRMKDAQEEADRQHDMRMKGVELMAQAAEKAGEPDEPQGGPAAPGNT